MNSLVEARVAEYLVRQMHYPPYDSSTIIFNMRALARVAGHELDEGFRATGLGSGPEGRVAASIVDRAMGGSGCETSDYTIRQQIKIWLRDTPRKGVF